MTEKETRIFRGTGLNKDDDLDFLSGGDSQNRHLMGFINGDYDTLIPRKVPDSLDIVLPGDTNTVIGVAHDEENNAAILFIYNSGDAHTIKRVYSDNTQENISWGVSEWGFDSDYPIYNPVIIGSGDDALLAWTDNNEPPKLIKIKDFVDGVHTTPDEGNSYLHKPSPTEKPTLALNYDSDVDYSRLSGNLFQFACRWVYDTGQKSVLSPWSDTIYNYEDDFFDEAILDVVNNYITVTVGADDWTAISKVEFFVRELDVGSGATKQWKHFDTVDADSATETTDFYNDEEGIYYTDLQMNRLSDHVPYTARTLEFIMGNRISLGGFNYGRDKVTPDITFEQVGVELGDETYLVNDEVNFGADLTGTDDEDFDIKLTWGEENHVIVEFWYTDGTNITTETYIVKSDAGYNAGSASSYYDNNLVIDALLAQITNNTQYAVTATKTVGGGMNDRLNIEVNIGADHLNVSVFVTNSRTKLRSMKENCKAYWGIAYYGDDGRESRVYLDDSMNTQIKVGTSTNDNVVEEQIGIKYTIDSLYSPPSWATSWQWLYGGSSIPYWFYLPATFHEGKYEASDATYRTPDLTLSKGRMRLNLTEALNRVEDKFGYALNTFTPVEGDYVRLVGYSTDTDETIITATPQQEMFPIVDVQEESGDTILYFYSADFDTPRPIVLLEIFRQQELSDVEDIVYREVGDRLAITSAGHVCSVPSEFTGEVTAVNQDLEASTPVDGEGVIDFGNCYIYPVYWCYSFNEEPLYQYSDTAPFISRGEFMSSYLTRDSAHYGQGRANYSDDDETNKDYNAIFPGGTFNDTDLDYNELNKFTLGDEKYLNDKHGEIYGLREMGFTLYALQRSKVTPIDLGRQVVEQDGTALTVSTDVVLGSDRPFEEDFGTVYSGSITKYGRTIWFFDPLNGAVYQLAQNGLTDISNYKMKSFFTDLAQDIGGDFTDYEFRSFYDIITQTYVLMFIDSSTPANNWSMSYYPVLNKWGCTENYRYSGGISLGGTVVYSFDADVYEHHKDGVSYEAGYLDAHFNQPNLLRKQWKYIEIDSAYRYSTSANPSVWVDVGRPDYTDPNTYVQMGGSMQSRIPNNRYKRVNSKYKAAFLRSTVSRDGTALGDNALYQGDRLAGKHATIRVTNTETTEENVLRAISVGFQIKGKQK